MKRVFLLLVLVCQQYYSFSQKTIERDSLYKYSYFIYGDNSSTSIEKGTGFFIKKNHKIYLVTANHVLTGWNVFKKYKEVPYPDTMYVRLYNKITLQPDFIPIPIVDFKARNYGFYLFEKPDICFYELKIPDYDIVYSVEKLVEKYQDKIEVDELIVYGFPIVDSRITKFDLIRLAPEKGIGKIHTDKNDSGMFKWDNTYLDTINYIGTASLNQRIGPGDSGAPVFLQSKNSKHKEIIFGGLVSGGGSVGDSVAMYIVKPLLIKKMLNKILPLN